MVGSFEGKEFDRRRDKKSKSGAFLVISDYFRDVELRIRNAEIIADKKVDFSEFGPR